MKDHSKFDDLGGRWKGIACILGPVLGLVGAIFFVMGDHVVEGVVGFFGTILFIPMIMAISRVIGSKMPRFGVVCAVLGLLGWVGGSLMMNLRVVYSTLVSMEVPAIREAGDFDGAIQVLAENTPELAIFLLVAPLGPLSFLLSGIGLLLGGPSYRWSGTLIFLAGICFFTAQLLLIQMEILYPLSMVFLLLGAFPIGWKALQGDNPAGS